jgi:hypothetical protein
MASIIRGAILAFSLFASAGAFAAIAQLNTDKETKASPSVLSGAKVQPPRVAPALKGVPAEILQPRIPANTDADGDGAVDVRVGGTDCDDNNHARYPDNAEIANDLDEDCDPDSIGWRDLDEDGYVDAAVSNPGGQFGTDCNDQQAAIRPDAQELPNRIDDDCDGVVDDLLGTWWTPAP